MRDELAETRRREEQGDREIASLTDRLDDTRAEREKDELRRDSEASHLKARLEDTAQKFNQTMLEKRQFEERARSEIEVRDSRAGELEKQLERRHAETQGLLKDQKEQVAKLESRIADLNRTLEGERDERESLESRYLKELEDTHDTYMKRMAEKEAEMRKEVEDLRNGALDAKRQLKASQLAAQRLTERITKLETERPLKSGAE